MIKRKAFLVQSARLTFISGVFFITSWVALGIVAAPELPVPAKGSRTLYDKQGKILSISLSAEDKYRLIVPLEQISKAAIDATLAYEDRRFYSHFGINPYSLFRGALRTLIAPQRPIGGSTITMQLARLLLGLNTRSVSGKLRQIFWALVLERHYSKTQILEAYLNTAPYGSNVEGIAAASLVYFRKRASELTLPQAVTLAVLPQHPSQRPMSRGKNDLDRARSILNARLKIEDNARELEHSVADTPASAQHFFCTG